VVGPARRTPGGPPQAGDSLRRVQKSAKAEWARGRRSAVRSAVWWAIPLCVVVGVAAALITHRAYFGYGFAALALLAMADIALTRPGGLGEAGQRAAGEVATAKAFKPLRYLGYTSLHDRRLPPNLTPGAAPVDVEHLLVGPAGVFLVDSKNWASGPKVQFAEKGLWRGLQNQGPILDRVISESKALTEALGNRLPAGVTVQPVMVLHIKELQPTPRYMKGILILLPHQLDPVFRSMRQVMSGSQAQSLTASLDRILAPRTGDRFTSA
jgi:hypothetical protein